MKVIVLENGNIQEVPEELLRYLDHEKMKWELYNMNGRFWPENRKETFEFFNSLTSEDLLICNTTFEDFQQLELMIELFTKLKKNLKLIIQHPCLCDSFFRYYNQHESDITPRTDEYDYDPKLRKKFKLDMNEKFISVLKDNQIFWLKVYGSKLIPIKTLEDITNKNNRYEDD